jgi:taurine dioxygenase
MTGRRTPPKAAILRGIKIPPLGGDTMWACARSAYQGLDQKTREQIEHLEAEHDMMYALGRYLKSDEERAKITELYPRTRHPIVRVHPDTGERMLFVNASFTTGIPDLPAEEGRALLQRLFAQFRRPEYQVRFSWTPDALAFWDERATQHYAVQGFEGAEERYLERVTIVGDAPFGVERAQVFAAA